MGNEAHPEPSGAAGWVEVVHFLNADGYAIRGKRRAHIAFSLLRCDQVGRNAG